MSRKVVLRFSGLVVAVLLVSLAVLAAVQLHSAGASPKQSLDYYTALTGPGQATVEKGAYLARAGNCQTCHTTEEGSAFAGGVAFRTDFGVLYSTNITPDKTTGIGQWSFADFFQSMKVGLRPDGEHLYPAFPYTNFALLSESDIASLYLYLQSLDPVAAPARNNDLKFPYNQRPLLALWKKLFHRATTYESMTSRSLDWNRGAYLVEGVAHCGACHTPRNFLGAEKPSLAFTGGVHQDRVLLGGYRWWSAVNLTSDSSGLASWREQDIVDYLRTGASDKAVVHGPMRDVVMHSTRYLSEGDLQAMAVYLKSLPAKQQDKRVVPSAQTTAAGEIVYTVHCGSCHLPTGLGAEGLGVALVGNPIVQAPSAASLINVILYGPHLPERPFSVARSNMKMFGKRLSDEDIAQLASYLRTSFGHNAGAVTIEEVRAQR
ncbi:cytochrome c [Halioxenophilus sp. WMMB6]|uniref:cytochrome c n=1 Tax=Halioxenophilus sp. WMMB6 TaxID=3073815 RepID=UPI00295EFCA9|nr:cytochrome c [Halioxenophilus sp. WMMB6]